MDTPPTRPLDTKSTKLALPADNGVLARGCQIKGILFGRCQIIYKTALLTDSGIQGDQFSSTL